MHRRMAARLAMAAVAITTVLPAVIAGAPVTAAATAANTETALVSSFTATTIRNDFTGRVGMRITVGGADISVSQLGRSVLAGNAGLHAVVLLDANGVTLGTATVLLAGQPAGSFAYAPMVTPVVLRAGASYFVLSEELAGGDTWFDWTTNPVTTTAGQVTAAAYVRTRRTSFR